MKSPLTKNQAQAILDLINYELDSTTRQKLEAEKQDKVMLFKILRAQQDSLVMLRSSYLELLKQLTFKREGLE